ncbi:hypothetical protein [Mesorhizobium sp. Cs1299R1N3]|uniref:hypothetical protein n=1 Tax=Mesorhizobium sp. Cs1299R1N3 TaxID=3015173 RepID=UPI00301C9C8A
MIVSFGARNTLRAWLIESAKHPRQAPARSKGLRWLLGQPRCFSLFRQAGLSNTSNAAYLRAMPASRYSHGRKEFFISAKWISAGTI